MLTAEAVHSPLRRVLSGPHDRATVPKCPRVHARLSWVETATEHQGMSHFSSRTRNSPPAPDRSIYPHGLFFPFRQMLHLLPPPQVIV